MHTWIRRALICLSSLLTFAYCALCESSTKETALVDAVTAAAQWKPSDPRVAKAYGELAGYYTAQSRYPEAEKLYQKRLELEEDALGRANPQLIPAVEDLARVNFAQMKFARAAELFARSLRIMEREYGEQDPKLASRRGRSGRGSGGRFQISRS
jgi:tetratricopeptide (TPR) repeat protein